MKLLLHIWRTTGLISKKERFFGLLFGLFLLLILRLPCLLQNMEGYGFFTLKSHSIDLAMHALIFSVFVLDFPTLILLPLVQGAIWIVQPLFWMFFLHFYCAVLRYKHWELGIWIGVYLAIGGAFATMFSWAAFLPC